MEQDPVPLTSVVTVEGNPSCADLGYGSYAFKIDPPTPGTYDLDGLNTATMTTDGIYFDWTATIGIDAVIVKGGPNASVWVYSPESYGANGLSPPINPSTGIPYGISHIEFCFDYELAVSKTANASLTRTYSWSIDKAVDDSSVLLQVGESYLAHYIVTITRLGFVDSNWAVSGQVSIHNPAPFVAEIESVTDMLDGVVPVALDCPVAFPYDLAAGASLQCTYALSLEAAGSHVNQVDVSTCGIVAGGSATAAVSFASPTITEVDNCATVSDDHLGELGTACDSAAFQYTLQIGPYETCGSTDTFVNTASYVTCDTSSTGSDSVSVDVTVAACDVGCTLTPGYWKTHSSYGPAPYDELWATLASGADTPFFLSGASYYDVLWTPPAGNAYYILAHAYIAAELNQAAGASGGAISVPYAQATTILNAVTPTYVRGLKKTSALVVQMIALASTLDDYNNGLIGPGHCSE
ncbi:MAG TPA: hypothetical protein VFQ53_12425 [Kofleriaceae bacterium]|nr:hypothetical protein [Kofleriaceae bacterium]